MYKSPFRIGTSRKDSLLKVVSLSDVSKIQKRRTVSYFVKLIFGASKGILLRLLFSMVFKII